MDPRVKPAGDACDSPPAPRLRCVPLPLAVLCPTTPTCPKTPKVAQKLRLAIFGGAIIVGAIVGITNDVMAYPNRDFSGAVEAVSRDDFFNAKRGLQAKLSDVQFARVKNVVIGRLPANPDRLKLTERGQPARKNQLIDDTGTSIIFLMWAKYALQCAVFAEIQRGSCSATGYIKSKPNGPGRAGIFPEWIANEARSIAGSSPAMTIQGFAAIFFDYAATTLLTTYRAYSRRCPASLIEGVF
jgi:hypothetical protein